MPGSVASQTRSLSRGSRGRNSLTSQQLPRLSIGKHSARTRASLSSGRSSAMTFTEPQGQGLTTRLEKQTVKFVYSQAVEKAFKRNYCCSQFGPPSAKPREPRVEIVKLPEMYRDFLMVRTLLESNQRHIERLRARGELIREKSVVKLPKMTFRNAVNRLKQRPKVETSVPKLPPLGGDDASSESQNALTSQSSISEPVGKQGGSGNTMTPPVE